MASPPIVPFVDLKRGYLAARTEIDGAIRRVLDSGRFVLADAVEEFERAFAAFCGTAHGVGVASGTDALHLALRACGIGDGDEVVTVANTCVPTVAAIAMSGATPVFADVDPGTLTLDPDTIEAALTPRTRAIVPVHLYGRCADMPRILQVARRHGLRVIEDAAQSVGACVDGRMAGAMGDAGAVSFYPTKNLGALGDAGMVVTSDPVIAERVRMLRSYGEVARYDSRIAGFNSRLDEMQAAILAARLPRLAAGNARRRHIAAAYEAGLRRTALGLPADDPGHVYHLYVVRTACRDTFRAELASRGITTLVHYPVSIPRQPAYAQYASALSHLPHTERACAEVTSLPLFPELTDEEVARVVEACVAAARRRTDEPA
jgi:dTDP-4-amino-4,6-dideoxygalactose transaminase